MVKQEEATAAAAAALAEETRRNHHRPRAARARRRSETFLAAAGAGGIQVATSSGVGGVTAPPELTAKSMAQHQTRSSGAAAAAAVVAPGGATPLVRPEPATQSEHRLPRWMSAQDADATPPSEPSGAYLAAKRLLDLSLASALLVMVFPVLVAVGLAIWVEDRGPILYYQTRVGRGGRTFRFYKFRSMVRNADALKDLLAAQNESTGPAFKMRHDPRVTRIGRWLRRYSVDELPQLLNVLRGEMSLVGPRPHLPREVEQYAERQRGRLAVQPGLLCLREVLGRSNVSFEQWVEWDLLYVRHRSLRTDLWILARSVPAVLKADGAF